ncbi:MAG: hypothetical protein CMJ18_15320 [Phycisphaeraceae bacterium]|nr:hypothetical protein [Phycisphaeraceae bacterium]
MAAHLKSGDFSYGAVMPPDISGGNPWCVIGPDTSTAIHSFNASGAVCNTIAGSAMTMTVAFRSSPAQVLESAWQTWGGGGGGRVCTNSTAATIRGTNAGTALGCDIRLTPASVDRPRPGDRRTSTAKSDGSRSR